VIALHLPLLQIAKYAKVFIAQGFLMVEHTLVYVSGVSPLCFNSRFFDIISHLTRLTSLPQLTHLFVVKTMKLAQCYQHGMGTSQLRNMDNFVVFSAKAQPLCTSIFLQSRGYKSSHW